MQNTQKISKAEALKKIEHYCAYQERCHKEVNEKLKSFGLFKSDRDELIVTLIDSGYLNEERFVRAFIRGKFNQKNWGKLKIRNELKIKGIHDNLIERLLSEIDEKEYHEKLKKLLIKKSKEIKGGTVYSKKHKLFSYLYSKGYESNVIGELLEAILMKKD